MGVATAIVLGFVGASSINISDTDNSIQTQNVGIGAKVLIEKFDVDGNLIHSFEDHNLLVARNQLAGCISGLLDSSNVTCSPLIEIMYIDLFSQQFLATGTIGLDPTLTALPQGCDINNNECTGFRVKGTYGPAGECESGVNCTELVEVGTGYDSQPFDQIISKLDFTTFNLFAADPLELNTDDTLVVTMDFEIPA